MTFPPILKKTVVSVTGLMMLSTAAFAAPNKRAPAPKDTDVESVKENYWNRTSDGDVEVVQNRLYSKKNRLSLQIGAGTVSTDPFLNVKSVSGGIGFHFSESLGLYAIGRKYLVSDSSYLTELRNGVTTGAATSANVNRPNSYFGGELQYSPFYGKMSLSGASIIHYDAHFLLGLGVTDTESGKYSTPSIGFGPEFYLGKTVAVRLDYRLTYYSETIRERILTTRTTAGERDNFGHHLTLGLEFFL